jgi:sporulation integral membrane protein YlbJ
MYRVISNRKLSRGAVYTALMLSMFALVYYSEATAAAAKDGLSLCFNVIIPSLFPFFVMSSLVVELGLAEKLGRLFEPIMRPLFNVSGVCAAAFVLGFIGGYPVGAKTAIALYKNGSIGKSEAERLLSFCNNSGPAFIFGVVGAGIFSSSLVGLLLYCVHMLASVVVGIIFRGWGDKGAKKSSAKRIRVTAVSYSTAFTQSVTGSFSSMLNITAFVVLFTVIIKLLFSAGILPWLAEILQMLLAPVGITKQWCERLLTGIIELTSGVWSLQAAATQLGKAMAMAAFMLGWAGLSIHCQVLSFVSGSGLSVKSYILGKLLHGIISAAFIGVFTRLFSLRAPVASYLAGQVKSIASLDFRTALRISSVLAFIILLAFFILSLIICREKYRTLHKKGV